MLNLLNIRTMSYSFLCVIITVVNLFSISFLQNPNVNIVQTRELIINYFNGLVYSGRYLIQVQYSEGEYKVKQQFPEGVQSTKVPEGIRIFLYTGDKSQSVMNEGMLTSDFGITLFEQGLEDNEYSFCSYEDKHYSCLFHIMLVNGLNEEIYSMTSVRIPLEHGSHYVKLNPACFLYKPEELIKCDEESCKESLNVQFNLFICEYEDDCDAVHKTSLRTLTDVVTLKVNMQSNEDESPSNLHVNQFIAAIPAEDGGYIAVASITSAMFKLSQFEYTVTILDIMKHFYSFQSIHLKQRLRIFAFTFLPDHTFSFYSYGSIDLNVSLSLVEDYRDHIKFYRMLLVFGITTLSLIIVFFISLLLKKKPDHSIENDCSNVGNELNERRTHNHNSNQDVDLSNLKFPLGHVNH